MKKFNLMHRALPTFLSLLLVMALVTYAAAKSRNITPMAIKTTTGKQVGLYKESHALVIGVSDYTNGWPDLPGVKKDVIEVKEALEKNGFHVETVMDPDSQNLKKAYTNFITSYGNDEENRLLFYFAGHGHTLKLKWGGEMGYIVPSNAQNPNQNEDAFRDQSLDMELIEVYSKRIQSKHALFLFDSCFSGSIFSLGRAVPENISRKTTKPVRQYITSGSSEEQVPDESIFRSQFVAALDGEGDTDRDGYVTGTELGEFLQKNVVNYSSGAQNPQYGKIRNPRLDKGDFVFLLSGEHGREPRYSSKKVGKIVPSTTGPNQTALDLEFWSSVKDSKNPAMFKAYLTEYPSGKFSRLARINLKNLEPPPPIQAVPRRTSPQTAVYQPTNATISSYSSQTWTDSTTDMAFVKVPGGCYQMGSDSGSDDEKPVHEVCVKDFYMGKYEVTQGQWEKIMGSNPSYFKKGDTHPVENISWDDTQKYLKKLSARSSGSYRLPTEAEWEYACRSGGKSEKYSGGNNAGRVAWYSDNAGKKTHQVGTKAANGLGLYDMSGNVYEWVQDIYAKGAYSKHGRNDPIYEGSGSSRVSRGGSWFFLRAWSARCADRDNYDPGYRYNNLGFRVVAVSPGR